jgi:hypothetical protein
MLCVTRLAVQDQPRGLQPKPRSPGGPALDVDPGVIRPTVGHARCHRVQLSFQGRLGVLAHDATDTVDRGYRSLALLRG